MQVTAAAATGALASILALRVWDWFVEPHLFEARLRTVAKLAGEPCVLDVSPTTAALFRRGGMALICRDLCMSGMPGYLRRYIEALMIARGADQAFRTKVELVNYKKVAHAIGRAPPVLFCVSYRSSKSIYSFAGDVTPATAAGKVRQLFSSP